MSEKHETRQQIADRIKAEAHAMLTELATAFVEGAVNIGDFDAIMADGKRAHMACVRELGGDAELVGTAASTATRKLLLAMFLEGKR